MSRTEERKQEILDLIGKLFGDTKESREEQHDALEEIASDCEGKCDALEADMSAEE